MIITKTQKPFKGQLHESATKHAATKRTKAAYELCYYLELLHVLCGSATVYSERIKR
jgi:hypothetical protein